MDKIKISKIIRSRRKTISIIVTDDAELIIRAPIRTSFKYLKSLVNEKNSWIKAKLKEILSKPKPKVKEFISGETFLYLGKSYKLIIVDNVREDIELKDDQFLSVTKSPNIRDILIDWYRSEAWKRIKERCNYYSETTGYKPLSIKITNAQKRWGSCSSRGTINFNWRLIMAPLEVIDYVVVHELVHLEHRNHSKLFWDKVKTILPDFRTKQKWLKDNGLYLNI